MKYKMSSGLKPILLVTIVCVLALLEHGGPTMAVPTSTEKQEPDNSKSSHVEFCLEHIGLSDCVPCLDCELLTLLCYEIGQEHQPSDGLARNVENPEGLDELNEASIHLEYADEENQVPEPANDNEGNINLLQGNFQLPQVLDDPNDQLVPHNQAGFLAAHGESTTTMDIEEELYQESD